MPRGPGSRGGSELSEGNLVWRPCMGLSLQPSASLKCCMLNPGGTRSELQRGTGRERGKARERDGHTEA